MKKQIWVKRIEEVIYNITFEQAMRVACIIIFCLLFLFALNIGAHGEELEDIGKIVPDPMRPTGLHIVEDGEVIERIEPDELDTRRWIIIDKSGDAVGTIEPDPIRPKQYIIKRKK